MSEVEQIVAKMAVQDEKLENILSITKDMQRNVEVIRCKISDMEASDKLKEHKLDRHERDIEELKKEVSLTKTEIITSKAESESSIRFLKFMGSVITIILGALALLMK